MTHTAGAQYRPLGCFRFGLAMMVVLQHYQHLLPPGARAAFSHMGFGAIAVCVFFAVSGFVVAEANAIFYAGRPGVFLLNRALRLGPPYAAALLLSVLVHAALWQAGSLQLWDYTLHTSPLAPARLASGVLALVPGFDPRWLGADFEFIPFVWTLRLEIAFYVAAFCVMAACARLRARWPTGVAIVTALAASAVFLLLARRQGALSTAPMFLLGVSLYLWDSCRTWRRACLLAAATLLAFVGFASWRQHGAPILAWQMSLLTVLLAIFALLAIGFAGQGGRRDRRLGDLSYPLYLNHYALGILAGALLPWRGWWLWAGVATVAVALAAVAERTVDRPFRRLRNKVRAVPL